MEIAVVASNQPAPLRDVTLEGPLAEGLRRDAPWAEAEAIALAAELGGEPRDWGRLANEHPPKLRGDGEVEFHPAWNSLLALGLRQ